jgi:hypothetical protein
MTYSKAASHSPNIDYITLISISMLAYAVTTILHEYLGHAATCAFVGGSVKELNAFYVDCQYGTISDLSIRLVAIAGPFVSLIAGLVGFGLIRRLKHGSSHASYFLWLFSTISLMTATGYLMFSGVLDLGDFGTTRDGALFQLAPEWLWRGAITMLGLAGYIGVVIFTLRAIDSLLGGETTQRVARAQTLALVSYLSGAGMAILIGFLNPNGIVIVLISAAASTLGGTSALAWMMQLLKRDEKTAFPLLSIQRDWRWVGVSLVVIILYAVVFGPSIWL